VSKSIIKFIIKIHLNHNTNPNTMKYPIVVALTLLYTCRESLTFTIPHQCQTPTTPSATRLEATDSKGRGWKPAVSGAIMGWILATKIATADTTPLDMAFSTDHPQLQEFSTTLLAQGAYVPEGGYEDLSMAMPSYSVKKDARFNGVGTEEIDTPVTSYESKGKTAAKQKSLADIEKAKNLDKAAKEEAKIKAYVEKQGVRSKENAEKQRIKAKIEAERSGEKEARSAERAAREK